MSTPSNFPIRPPLYFKNSIILKSIYQVFYVHNTLTVVHCIFRSIYLCTRSSAAWVFVKKKLIDCCIHNNWPQMWEWEYRLNLNFWNSVKVKRKRLTETYYKIYPILAQWTFVWNHINAERNRINKRYSIKSTNFKPIYMYNIPINTSILAYSLCST